MMGNTSLLVAHEIFLRIALEVALAGRAAEVEFSTIVAGMVTGGRYLYRHATDRVDSRLLSGGGLLSGPRRLWSVPLLSRYTATLHLHQFGDDAGGDLLGRDRADVESRRRFETRHLLLREAGCAQVGATGLHATRACDHTYIASRGRLCLFQSILIVLAVRGDQDAGALVDVLLAEIGVVELRDRKVDDGRELTQRLDY